MYNEKMIEIFNNLKNAGIIRGANGIGVAENADYGDIVKLYIKTENGKVTDAKFKTFGSMAAIVVSSVVAELIIGKTLSEATNLEDRDIVNITGKLPKDKEYCILLAKDAVLSAVEDYNIRIKKDAKKSNKKIIKTKK